ncbi:sugar phosphate isomerase/epimerase [Pseudomaricurvus alcaniphilus]|uniref:sugar phosphate isomerase/epimerase family protein n=1 Tax=Pseudomaricurvus alcaniphilus TaxID=1166482 RepID=UPI00140DA375|nr:sugar phosphate isomerase/epimerase [Pseudomaricurvus alcaniphilus]NHN36861.1 sugar phosphate isomerase/epimerase [Pseudomaricurvus alcaniphilus]
MQSASSSNLRLGSTLYSFTTEYHNHDYSFESLIRRIAAENLGPGLEIVGFQSIKGFPVVSDAYADWFRGLIDEVGLELSCLGINSDFGINRDRKMTEDELFDYHVPQLHAAAKLGFPLIRYQYGAGPEAIKRLVPEAEKLGLKLALEIHASHHVQHPVILAFREMYEQVNSPLLGFIPDFGASVHSVPPSFLDFVRSIGVAESMIDLALEVWHAGGNGSEMAAQFYQKAVAMGGDADLILELFPIFGLFSRQDPRDWAEIMPQTFHIHGKFFDFADDGAEASIDYASTLKVFVEGDFNGYMSSEYEGHHWTDADAFDKVRRHHALASSILHKLG